MKAKVPNIYNQEQCDYCDEPAVIRSAGVKCCMRHAESRGDMPSQRAAGACAVCGEVHTPGALDAARVLMNGKTMIATDYGRKKVCGVASLIDNETHGRELMTALKTAAKLVGNARQYFPKSIKNSDKFGLELACAEIGKAIHAAQGES